MCLHAEHDHLSLWDGLWQESLAKPKIKVSWSYHDYSKSLLSFLITVENKKHKLEIQNWAPFGRFVLVFNEKIFTAWHVNLASWSWWNVMIMANSQWSLARILCQDAQTKYNNFVQYVCPYQCPHMLTSSGDPPKKALDTNHSIKSFTLVPFNFTLAQSSSIPSIYPKKLET